MREYYMLVAFGSRGDLLMRSVRLFPTKEQAVEYYKTHFCTRSKEPHYRNACVYQCSEDTSPKVVVKTKALWDMVPPEFD